MKKVGYLKNAVAKPNGFYSQTGEKLKGQALTDEFIAEWNGTAKPKAAPAPKVEEVTEEVVEEAPKPVAKKKGKKKATKKSTLGSLFGAK